VVINCSGERSVSRFKRIKTELKGRNIPGDVVHTKHSVHYEDKRSQTNFNEFLDDFGYEEGQEETILFVYSAMFSLT